MAAAPSPGPASSPSRYREAPAPPGLGELVACVWRHDAGSAGHLQRVVPDGCVDLIWRAGRELVVAGPATEPVLAALPPGSTTLGVRFRPGAGAAFLGLPLSELRDRDVALEELWSSDVRRGDGARRLAEVLWDARSPADRLALLTDSVLSARPADVAADPLVAAAVRRIRAADRTGDVRVAALGSELGVSERQLLRRFRSAVGYGPKTLARVLRFQRFLAAAWTARAPVAGATGHETLARLAVDAGYADQAHLARECRALAGVPPGRLLHGS